MSPPPYELVVDGFARDLFRVYSLTGTEVLSEAYDFEITATAELGQDIERRALGRRASLVFHTEPPTTIAVTDAEDGSPLAYQRYVIKLDDGTEVSGMTDEGGKAELELSTAGKITFPELTMPDDKSGKGPMLPYVIRQGDYLKKLAFVHG